MNNPTQTASLSLIDPLQPELSVARHRPRRWGRLYGCSDALVIATAARRHAGPVIAITTDMQAADRLNTELHFFLKDNDIPNFIFPDWESPFLE